MQVNRTDNQTDEPKKKGPSKSALTKLLTEGLQQVAQGYLKTYLGDQGAAAVAEFGSSVVGKLVDGFVAPEGAGKKELGQATGKFATDYIEALLARLAGEPPAGDTNSRDISKARTVKVKDQEGRYRLSSRSHAVAEALKLLGIPSLEFGEGVNAALGKAKADREISDLGNAGSWLKTIRYLFAGILKDNDQAALAKIFETVPVEQIIAKKTEEQPQVDKVEPKPTSEMGGTTSSTASRNTNFASLYIDAYRARANLGKDAEGPKVGSTEEVVKHLISNLIRLDGENAPSEEKIKAVAAQLKTALAPLERESKLDRMGAIRELISLATKDSQAAIKKLTSDIRDVERQKAGLKREPDAEQKRTELDSKLMLLRARIKDEEEKIVRWEGKGEEPGLIDALEMLSRVDLKRSAPGVDRALNVSLAMILEKVVAQKLGIEVPVECVTSLFDKYNSIIENLRLRGGLTIRAREKFEAERGTDAIFTPLLPVIDPSNPKESATKLADMLTEGMEDLSKKPQLISLLETMIPKVRSNLDLVGLCIDEITKLTGLSKKELGLDEFLQIMVETNQGPKPESYQTALESCRANIKTVRAELDNLDKGVANVQSLIEEGDPNAAKRTLSQHQAEKEKLEKSLTGARSDLAKAKREITTLTKDKSLENFEKADPDAKKFVDAKWDHARITKEKAKLEKAEPKDQAKIDELDKQLAALQQEIEKLATPEREEHAVKAFELRVARAKKKNFETAITELGQQIGGLTTKIAELEKNGATDPDTLKFFELHRLKSTLVEKKAGMERQQQPDTAKVEELDKQIKALETRIKALSTPEREKAAEGWLKHLEQRNQLVADRDRVKGTLKGLEHRQRGLENTSSTLLVGDEQRPGLLGFLASAVFNPEALKKFAEERKAEGEKDDPTKKTDKPDKPGDNNKPNGTSNSDGSSLATSATRGNPIVQERIRMCDLILSDPSLSTQDKILLFILVYAEYKKREQEDYLREFNKTEEKRNVWAADREKIDAEVKDQERVIKELEPRVAAADAELKKLQDGTQEYRDKAKELEGIRGALQNARDQFKNSKEKMVQHDTAPEARNDREMKMMMIERSMQEYDHLLRMADSLLQRYDRLVDQILRSMGQ